MYQKIAERKNFDQFILINEQVNVLKLHLILRCLDVELLDGDYYLLLEIF